MAELRRARSSGRKFTAHYKRDAEEDQKRSLLLIEALRGEAVQAERHVQPVAVECAEAYREQLTSEPSRPDKPCKPGVEAVREGLVELRRIDRRTEWIDMASQPVGRVKRLRPDVTGIEEALRPVQQLPAGPREHVLSHVLANWGHGSSGKAFTVDPSSTKARR